MAPYEYMLMALQQAQAAANADEVPVGAVLVCGSEVIARAHNCMEAQQDASCHAELIAMREGMKKLGTWRLSDCTLYVTLEPCAMCAGAAINAHLGGIVFGAYDERMGCCASATDIMRGLGYEVKTVGGVMEQECAQLLSDYFARKRG
ncbi:MAG: nucleoside deaminase [Clostridia bacterium]